MVKRTGGGASAARKGEARDTELAGATASSAKRVKISHYFGGAHRQASQQQTTPAPSATERGGREGSRDTDGTRAAGVRAGIPARVAPAKPGELGRELLSGKADGSEASAAPAPSWGKLVDPRKRRKLELLRRLQEGNGHFSATTESTAWAWRSYTLSYVPVFQDERTPGMGSSGGPWSWASQSHVFGGARACTVRHPSKEAPSYTNGTAESVDCAESQEVEANQARGENTAAAAAAAAPAAGDGSIAHAQGKRTLQLRNFEAMCRWLSTSRTASSAPGEQDPTSFLECALGDGSEGLIAAFAALESLAPRTAGAAGAPCIVGCDAVALALRMYHAVPTWRRIVKRPPARRRGSGYGARLHPDDAALAAEVDAADEAERAQRASAEFEAASKLVEAGLAVSLRDTAGGVSNGGGGDGIGGYFSRGANATDRSSDPLALLAPREALTAPETRALLKVLGLSLPSPPEEERERTNSSSGVTRGGGRDSRWARGSRGQRRRGDTSTDVTDEACQALENWIVRPVDPAKRRARLARASRQAAEVAGGRGAASRERSGCRGRGGGGRGGGDDGRGSGAAVLVVRLTDDARAAIHRVHVAFFAASRHGPLDAPAILTEDLGLVRFASAIGPESGPRKDAEGGEGEVLSKSVHSPTPPPQVLSSAEAFACFYRLSNLADAMDVATEAGDSGLAYACLHEASTTLLPAGCPTCRRYGPHATGSAVAPVVSSHGEKSAPKAASPPPSCDLCDLSARILMRGVGLMERDRDYESAFHYFDIVLTAPSQKLSVHRPRYWFRLVTDLSHKKRSMKALRSCEEALAEGGASGNFGGRAPLSALGNPRARGEAEARRAAHLPLGEALPLIRKAVRLAVPPLRWRKRSPPQLAEARLEVLSLDLSWRRGSSHAGARNGSATSSAGAGGQHGAAEENEAVGPDECDGGDEGAGGDTDGFGQCEAEQQSTTPSSVPAGTSLEQAVLENMLRRLGPQWMGMHAENSICLGVFALLCWDVVFAPAVPDSSTAAVVAEDSPTDVDEPRASPGQVYFPFASPFQSEPSDLMTTAFAERRRSILEHVFARLEDGDAATLIRQTWTRNYGKACTGLNWTLFADGVEGWITVAAAIGPVALSCLCRNLASNYWAWRHGLPDLFLWRKDAAVRAIYRPGDTSRAAGCSTEGEIASEDTSGESMSRGRGESEETYRSGVSESETLLCTWAEVKGPGDSLSCAQEAWIDTLVRAGQDTVLLRVKDTSSPQ